MNEISGSGDHGEARDPAAADGRSDTGRGSTGPNDQYFPAEDVGADRPRQASSVDELLARSAARLRSEASAMQGHGIVVQRLETKLHRTRRNGFVAVGVAAALLAATIGFVITEDGTAEIAAGVGSGYAPGSPEAIVAGLPPEPVDPHDVELVASVSRFGTCDALGEKLRTVGAAHVGSLGFGLSGSSVVPESSAVDVTAMRLADSGAPTFNFAGPGLGGDETLGTNVIVAGVDEPDRVKAVDDLVVDLSGTDLRVVDTSVGAIVGTLDLIGDTGESERNYAGVHSLLLAGDRAVVFGSETVFSEPIDGDPSATRRPVHYATVTFVDLSDPAHPMQRDRVRMEGHLVAARMVGDQVRIVTESTMSDLPMVAPANPSSVPVALEQNRLAVAGSSVDDWIPAWDLGEGTEAEPLVDCDQVVVPDTFAGVQMTSLVAFDIAGPFEPSSTAILAPSDDITATSQDVVVSSHIWVDPAKRDDGYEDWSSALHRFSFSDGAPTYVASGEVPGAIRDDFSIAMLDDSTVGVLTVDVLPWEDRADAKVTVRTLTTTRDVLEPLGELAVASGEHGSAGMRFIGERLLVSTGLAGNHLSVADLSDPTAPVSVGEVDLPGSGAYFHALEGDRVLVVGEAFRGVEVGGRAPWIKNDLVVSVVDLSGVPAVVTSVRTPETNSNVGWDHHVFTWWPSRSTAAFGVTHQPLEPRSLPPVPEAMFFGLRGDALVPTAVRPTEADLGPRCPRGQIDHSGCDATGPPEVNRVLVVGGSPWMYTSESLQRVEVGAGGPVTSATAAEMVVLPPPGH